MASSPRPRPPLMRAGSSVRGRPATFRVSIRGLTAHGVGDDTPDRARRPLLRIDFDSFVKTLTGEGTSRSATAPHTHVWPDYPVLTFEYTTGFADALSRKFLSFTLLDHNEYSSDEVLGVVELDLLTVAGGPVAHRLPIRDGTRTVGALSFSVVMEEVVSPLQVQVAGVGLAGPGDPSVSIEMGVAASNGAPLTQGCKGGGASPWAPPILSLPSVGDALAASLVFTVRKGAGMLGSASLPLKSAMSFVPGAVVPWRVALGAPGAAALTGTLHLPFVPCYAQMVGGLHTETGITGATFVLPPDRLTHRPSCPNEAESGGAGTPTAASAGSARAFSAAAIDAIPLSRLVYTPGSSTAPPIDSRLFGGAPGLPLCWVRRVDAATSTVAFENLDYNAVEPRLPTDAEYVISVPPSEQGPLGLCLEPNFSGLARVGWRSGRRNSGTNIGAVVRSVKPGTFLASSGVVRPGHHLIAINGSSTLTLSFDETVAALRATDRPIVLRLHNPHAVPADFATAAASMAAPASVLHPLAPLSVGGVTVQGNVNLQKLDGLGRKNAAEAVRTLDMALGALGRMAATQPASDAAGEDAAAAQERADFQAAVRDSGMLHTLSAVITGQAADALTGAGHRVDGDDVQGPPRTTDTSAMLALQALSVLTGTDDATLNRPDAPAFAAGSSALLRQRALAMSGEGLLNRTIEAVGTRNSPAFAGAAVHTVNTIMQTYGLGGVAAGLTGSNLVTLQSVTRKSDYLPVRAGAELTIAVLSSEFPYQDGKGFLVLVAAAVNAINSMTAAGLARACTPDGRLVTMNRGAPMSGPPPPVVVAATDAMIRADRASRLLDDAAVVAPSQELCAAIMPCLAAHAHDPFFAAGLLSCAAKLSVVPQVAAALAMDGTLNLADSICGMFHADARICEVLPALYFNVGRDLEFSEAILNAGGVPRIISIARARMRHVTSSTGSPCSWPPPGREREVGEVVVLEGEDRYAREHNAVSPRLVRVCVNVLINLACHRPPTAAGTSVQQIERFGGVQLLGDVLSSNLDEPKVVTSVLNAAANIAFKNRGVQLAIGELMLDAVILAGWQYNAESQLICSA